MNVTDIQVKNARDLSDAQIQAWSRIQESQPELDSSFFRPEFTQMVASVRDDVEVAILTSGEKSVGFFPFQKNWRNLAEPVSGRLSELHGLIAPSQLNWNAEQLTKACGISAWRFDHLLACQTPFSQFAWNRSDSPYMGLEQGYEHFVESRRQAGSSAVKQVQRKARKLEREVGPLRFEYHTSDETVLRNLVQWKTDQFKRTKRLDLFRYSWVTDLLAAAQQTQGNQFAGAMSALYASEELVAVHLGLTSREALHIWFPAYSRQFEKYSPGLVLLLNLAQEVAARGMKRIDFGRGPERYKQDFKTGDMALAEGAVEHLAVRKAMRRSWHGAKRWIRNTPLRRQLEATLRWSYRLREWLAVR